MSPAPRVRRLKMNLGRREPWRCIGTEFLRLNFLEFGFGRCDGSCSPTRSRRDASGRFAQLVTDGQVSLSPTFNTKPNWDSTPTRTADFPEGTTGCTMRTRAIHACPVRGGGPLATCEHMYGGRRWRVQRVRGCGCLDEPTARRCDGLGCTSLNRQLRGIQRTCVVKTYDTAHVTSRPRVAATARIQTCARNHRLQRHDSDSDEPGEPERRMPVLPSSHVNWCYFSAT